MTDPADWPVNKSFHFKVTCYPSGVIKRSSSLSISDEPYLLGVVSEDRQESLRLGHPEGREHDLPLTLVHVT